MGSQSDYSTMKFCEKILKILNIKYETNIISAHRTPGRMYKFAKNAENNNKKQRNVVWQELILIFLFLKKYL